jgi:hypothetical protein
LEQHLSDDCLASLFCRELPLAERWIARTHLANCWQCRLRQQIIEDRADRIPELYNDALDSEELPLSEESETVFSRRLKVSLEDEVPRRVRTLHFPKISLPELSPMSPALVTCMVFGFATILSFSFWWQQRAPRISSNALLVRAEKWDTASLATTTQGVVYQAVRITMTKQSKKEMISRSIYRDTQGKRQPKHTTLTATQEQVKSALAMAGLDWEEPLSASGYQNWHDHQHVREDHIARAGPRLLRLTTRVPAGVIAEQSLTVRDSDFHPVQRTVELRDSGTVEIAEVDFKILPWNAVDANLFEPLETAMSTAAGVSPARVLSFPRIPEALSESQLDGAELAARLVLNQLHADAGEQIEIRRGPQGIAVEGVVETDARKRELQAGLRMLSHVIPSIQSVDDIKADPSLADTTTSIRVASMPDEPSPLKTYLEAHGRGVSDLNSLTQRLFNNALAISQESKEIANLQSHFGSEEQKSVIASATLSELIYSHHERLDDALQSERELLGEIQALPHRSQGSTATGGPSLVDAADKNLALAKELTQTHSPAVRSAEKILADMAVTLNDLTADALEAYGKSQSDASLGRKK